MVTKSVVKEWISDIEIIPEDQRDAGNNYRMIHLIISITEENNTGVVVARPSIAYLLLRDTLR
jgi:hypothetical protein